VVAIETHFEARASGHVAIFAAVEQGTGIGYHGWSLI
jgi:hypothetical protein